MPATDVVNSPDAEDMTDGATVAPSADTASSVDRPMSIAALSTMSLILKKSADEKRSVRNNLGNKIVTSAQNKIVTSAQN